MRRLSLLFIAAVAGLATHPRAAGSDALTITIRPDAYYAVHIDTAAVALDLGTVELGASTQTVHPATVTIQSTFATTDLKIQGSIHSSGTPWTLDEDTETRETDKIAAWATFTSVERSSAPPQSGGYFAGTVPGESGSAVLSHDALRVGTTGAITGLYEADGEFGGKSMNALPPDPDPEATSHLWLYFRLPDATTSADEQQISITVTATAPE